MCKSVCQAGQRRGSLTAQHRAARALVRSRPVRDVGQRFRLDDCQRPCPGPPPNALPSLPAPSLPAPSLSPLSPPTPSPLPPSCPPTLLSVYLCVHACNCNPLCVLCVLCVHGCVLCCPCILRASVRACTCVPERVGHARGRGETEWRANDRWCMCSSSSGGRWATWAPWTSRCAVCVPYMCRMCAVGVPYVCRMFAVCVPYAFLP